METPKSRRALASGRYFNFMEELYGTYQLKPFDSAEAKKIAKKWSLNTGVLTYMKAIGLAKIGPKKGQFCFLKEPVKADAFSLLSHMAIISKEYKRDQREREKELKNIAPPNPTDGRRLIPLAEYQKKVKATAKDDKVSWAISILKDAGYKVMKPITQFEEI